METDETDETENTPSATGFTTAREEVRHFVVQLPSSESFFQEICDFLALTLQMEYVLIGYVTGNKHETVQTIGISTHGRQAKNVAYGLGGTPCENVIGRNMCYYPLNVANLFPTDKILQDLNIQSYLGIPLNNPDGKPLGLISVFSKHPIQNAKFIEQILDEIKPRCELELAKFIKQKAKATEPKNTKK